jgi:hypothetical protein
VARIGAIEKLPNPVRLEVEKRIRAGESQRSIALWATGEGYAISARAVELHSTKLNTRRDNARDVAELRLATTEVIETSGIRTDLLTLSQDYLQQAMVAVGPDYFQSLRPIEMLNASSRIMAVEVQVQRLKEDLRSKAAIEIKAIEGELDLTEEMLIQIRQRIYGIFD